MTDIVSQQKRSSIMRAVGTKHTKPEMIVRRYLFSKGFRYKLHDKKLPGTPDIILPKYKCVIFINGCFWHGHENCKKAIVPKSNRDFWISKLNRNKQRDLTNLEELKKQGWNYFIIWGCELSNSRRSVTLHDLTENLKKILK